ncbi:MAG: zf-HC2 domain-containing protein [Anaerolineae bacterium]|nr:zf-HC2 domain-containing protein [Anaerolineae bacterium]
MTATCIDPSEIREGDLAAYADGEADERVRRHVRRCAHCAALVARYAHTDHTLRAGLYRAACPPAETLARWQLHILSPEEELRVAAHVRACPHCQRECMELEAAGDSAMSLLLDHLKDVTSWLVASRTAAPQPVRGGVPPQQRYRTAELDIFVGTIVVQTQRQLRGRIRPPIPGATVWLMPPDAPPRNCQTDITGYFIFPDVPPGKYSLGFAWQGRAVFLRDVDV